MTQCTPAHTMWFSIKWVSSQTKGSGCWPPFGPCKAISWLTCPALSLQIRERYWKIGVIPVESNYESTGRSAWLTVRGCRSWVGAKVKLDPSWSPQGKNKSQQSWLVPREIPAGHTENFLSDTSNAALAQGPEKAVESPSWESFGIQRDINLKDLY